MLDYLGLGCPIPSASWLDVRVFYVRVSCCSLEDAPECLTIRCVPRNSDSSLEVNGNRVPPAETGVLMLRRDRVDTESAEVTYISTDRLRTTGSLPFEVCDKEQSLICGSVEMLDGWSDGQAFDRLSAVGTVTKICKTGWTMDCKCSISSPGCVFLQGRRDSANSSLSSPSLEVYVAGRYSGSAVILTQTVQLLPTRKHCRRSTLDAIPETDELGRTNNNDFALSDQMNDHTFYHKMDSKPAGALTIYEPGGYMEGDDGEITWFNAGVRVGVGIGLGMCVGLGIGVGLLMRTYQATTRTFRRRFF